MMPRRRCPRRLLLRRKSRRHFAALPVAMRAFGTCGAPRLPSASGVLSLRLWPHPFLTSRICLPRSESNSRRTCGTACRSVRSSCRTRSAWNLIGGSRCARRILPEAVRGAMYSTRSRSARSDVAVGCRARSGSRDRRSRAVVRSESPWTRSGVRERAADDARAGRTRATAVPGRWPWHPRGRPAPISLRGIFRRRYGHCFGARGFSSPSRSGSLAVAPLTIAGRSGRPRAVRALGATSLPSCWSKHRR